MKTITLKFAATCRDCGAALEAGARARYYGRGKVYGVDCHTKHSTRTRMPRPRHFENEGHARSFYDPSGAYSPDGTFLGTTGPRCEDAPCCGCCS